MRLRVRRQAVSDLKFAAMYVADRNPAAADRLVERIRQVFETLARQPGLGSARDGLPDDLRVFPVEKYLIFYREIETGIEVVRVVHGARKWEDLV